MMYLFFFVIVIGFSCFFTSSAYLHGTAINFKTRKACDKRKGLGGVSIQDFDCSSFASGFECFQQYYRQDSDLLSNFFRWENLPFALGFPYGLLWFRKRLRRRWKKHALVEDEDSELFKERLDESFRAAMSNNAANKRRKNSVVQICPQCEGKKIFLGKPCDLCDGKGFIVLNDDEFYLPPQRSTSDQIGNDPSSLPEDDDNK